MLQYVLYTLQWHLRCQSKFRRVEQWAAEWAAHGNFAMQIRLPIRKNRGAAHFAAYGLHVSNGVGCPWAAHRNFAMQIRLPTNSIYGHSGQLNGQRSWLPIGILPFKLGFPLLPYMETVGNPILPNMKKWAAQWAVEWASHGLTMGILPCKLDCQLLPNTDIVGSSVGSPQLSSTEIVGSSLGSTLNCPPLNLKWKPSLIHMQDSCSTCEYNACYLS